MHVFTILCLHAFIYSMRQQSDRLYRVCQKLHIFPHKTSIDTTYCLVQRFDKNGLKSKKIYQPKDSEADLIDLKCIYT